ncbi:MAG: hypothetical protein ABR604_07350 [Jatrophihabitantaceae bacterium]
MHAVAEFVLTSGGNVLHAEQHIDREAGIFFQRVEFDLAGARPDRAEVETAFAPVASRFGMSVRVRFRTNAPESRCSRRGRRTASAICSGAGGRGNCPPRSPW